MLDQINGAFEAGLAVMLFLNLRRLMKDREVKGFDYKVVVFTTAWGIWNLFYYPALGQMFSFYAGIGVVSMNAAWLWLVWHYKRHSLTKEQWRAMYSRGNPRKFCGTLEDYIEVDKPLEK